MQKRNNDLERIHKIDSRNIEMKDDLLSQIRGILQQDLMWAIPLGISDAIQSSLKRVIRSIDDTLGLEWQYPEGSEEMKAEIKRLEQVRDTLHQNLSGT